MHRDKYSGMRNGGIDDAIRVYTHIEVFDCCIFRIIEISAKISSRNLILKEGWN